MKNFVIEALNLFLIVLVIALIACFAIGSVYFVIYILPWVIAFALSMYISISYKEKCITNQKAWIVKIVNKYYDKTKTRSKRNLR